MIEQHATTILIASIALNALWLLGAWLVVRTSKRRWLWRTPSLVAAALAVVWTARLTGSTPAPTHTLRLPLLPINLDLAAVAWHAIVLPLGLLAMALRAIVYATGRSPASAQPQHPERRSADD